MSLRPKLDLLDRGMVERILGEAFALLQSPGVKVGSQEARDLLASEGARVEDEIAHIPERIVRRALESVPREFCLYSRPGQCAVHYGGDQVHFDPGSSCLDILDSESGQPRLAMADDLVRLLKVTEKLPQFAAQSTAMVCNDVPSEMGDWYRLLLVLWFSDKPVVTGSFSAQTLGVMLRLLAADAGGTEALRAQPRAVFDVCPSPPLNWSSFAAENLMALAKAGVPAEMIPMPLAGATAPVTLAGAIVQHAAEALAGVAIHQLACAGSPLVWGGAPAIFDMGSGNTPMGAIETAMLNIGCAQVGKWLNMPTHGYLVASDARRLDAQAGMESGASAVLGALAGINMISGAGMLHFLSCHSVEKLVVDAEAIASAQRLITGVEPHGETLALGMFAQTGLSGEFLKLKETRALFRLEQHFPSDIVDRDTATSDLMSRARQRVDELLAGYQRPKINPEIEQTLLEIARREGLRAGLDHLPGISSPATVVLR